MVKAQLRYVNGITTKGVLRYYFRRNGKSYRLPDDPRSRPFLDAYSTLLVDTARGELPQRVAPGEGTFAALALLYYGSAEFKGRSPATKSKYRRIIDKFCEEHGRRAVHQMKRSHVSKIVGALGDHPGAANSLIKVLRLLLAFAVNIEWIDVNPAARTRSYDSTEYHTWTEDEISQFEAHYPLGARERLCFDVLLYTGQRVSDACAMSLPDAGGKIRIVQIKTKARLAVSVHPRLKASIAACPSGQLTILVTRKGKPMTAGALSQLMSKSIDKAGLPEECVAHGLRRAAARRLAEAGCSTLEIMSVTGHTTLTEVERYTRDYGQESLNAQALEKQMRNG
jgi:site-specific recombinase XerD